MPHAVDLAGEVTFLFTDIEGSTRLWEAYPDAMRRALARHDELVRNAIEAAGGQVFKTVGDAFYAVFAAPAGAVDAALAAQTALEREQWPPETPIRTRIAIHSGQAEARESDFFGPAVNRVARLVGIAHGGQTILSGSTREVVESYLPEGVTLRYLGEHRLKDLGTPEGVFQLCGGGLQITFPRLRTLESPVFYNNLPQSPTSFVGRDQQLREIRALLDQTRMLTLTGTGGTGKTRLSMRLAEELKDAMPNGVLFVELAPISDDALVSATLASLIGSKEGSDSVIDHLRNKRLLVVLDNCEHVLDASARIAAQLLDQCPGVRILTTSRQPLGISGESTYRVPSLSMPDADAPSTLRELQESEAARLFMERAAQARTDIGFTDNHASAVSVICRRLDGIPLALELAAARVRHLTVDEINGKLDQRFQLLTGGSRTALPRQQTLKSLIDWSYDMLEIGERKVFRRLSVFAGGWSLDAAQQVLGDQTGEWMTFEILSSLCDKSLVQCETKGQESRYRLLESIRQYGKDRLAEAGEEAHWRDRHLEAFLELAVRAEAQLQGPDQQAWLDRLDVEHDNIRAALDWGLTAPSRADRAIRLAGFSWRFWFVRGHVKEGLDWCEKLVEFRPDGEAFYRAQAINGAGSLAYLLGDYDLAERLYRQSLDIRREIDDLAGIGAGLNNLGNIAYERGDFEACRRMHEESLAIKEQMKDEPGVASSLNNLGNVYYELGDYEKSRYYQEQSLQLCRDLGHTVGVARSLINLGNVAFEQRDFATARTLQQESLTIRREIGEPIGIANCLERLGAIAAAQGDFERAGKLYGAEERMREELELARPPNELMRYDRQVGEASTHPAFLINWEAGRRMRLEEALDLALDPAH